MSLILKEAAQYALDTLTPLAPHVQTEIGANFLWVRISLDPPSTWPHGIIEKSRFLFCQLVLGDSSQGIPNRMFCWKANALGMVHGWNPTTKHPSLMQCLQYIEKYLVAYKKKFAKEIQNGTYSAPRPRPRSMRVLSPKDQTPGK